MAIASMNVAATIGFYGAIVAWFAGIGLRSLFEQRASAERQRDRYKTERDEMRRQLETYDEIAAITMATRQAIRRARG